MSICPNCSYELVLLSTRSKYKCALCSKLYPQKEIDNKEFKEFNKRSRIEDFKEYKKEETIEYLKIKEINKHLRTLFSGVRKNNKNYAINKERIKLSNKEWRLKNREYDLARKRAYYLKNKKKLIFKDSKWRKNNLVHSNKKKVEWRNRNLDEMRIYGMIQHYRRKQKALTLRYLENDQHIAYNTNIFDSVPTFPLSELLIK
ncbi:MAG: hypothetical protein AABX77_00770 [Nanoarchaeota archaeon]